MYFINLFRVVEASQLLKDKKKSLNLNCKEILCPRSLLKHKTNIIKLEKFEAVIKKTLSIENLISKLIEHDMLKYIMFNEEQLVVFNNLLLKLPYEKFNLVEGVKIREEDVQSSLNKINMDGSLINRRIANLIN